MRTLCCSVSRSAVVALAAGVGVGLGGLVMPPAGRSGMAAGHAEPVPVDVAVVLGRYERWLARQPGSEHGGAALTEVPVRDWAVRDYKRLVKAAPRRWAPASVNQALAALDNFYRHLGVGRPEVARRNLPGWRRERWTPPSNGRSCGRYRRAPRRGTGRSRRCCSTPGCGCPNSPRSMSRTSR